MLLMGNDSTLQLRLSSKGAKWSRVQTKTSRNAARFYCTDEEGLSLAIQLSELFNELHRLLFHAFLQRGLFVHVLQHHIIISGSKESAFFGKIFYMRQADEMGVAGDKGGAVLTRSGVDDGIRCCQFEFPCDVCSQ